MDEGKKAEALARAIMAGAKTPLELLMHDVVVPFGVFALDYLLLSGTGGVPVGRLVELYGEESSGKSSLAYRLIASAQRMFPGRGCALYDIENRLQDKHGIAWLARMGVDIQRPDVVINNPEHTNELFSNVLEDVSSGAFSVVLIDSLAQSSPDKMLEARKPGTKQLREFGEKRSVAQEARAVTEFVKAVAGPVARTKSVVVIINQLRDVIADTPSFFGTVKHTPGGRALKFISALRLSLERRGNLYADGKGVHKSEKRACGVLLDAEVVKCKFAPEGKRTGVDTPGPIAFHYRSANPVDDIYDVFRTAVDMELIHVRGAWYDCETLGVKAQGEQNFIDALHRDNKYPALYEQVVDAVKAEASEMALSGIVQTGTAGEESCDGTD